MGMGCFCHTPGALPPGKVAVIQCTGGWLASGPVWIDTENLALTGIRFPGSLAGSESLYRLRYVSNVLNLILLKMLVGIAADH
jgi:hypothetical protein